MSRSFEGALQELAAQIPRSESKDTFDGLDKRLVSEVHFAPRILFTSFWSSARLESTVRQHIASIPVLAEDAVVGLLNDVIRAMEASSDTSVMLMIGTVLNDQLERLFRVLTVLWPRYRRYRTYWPSLTWLSPSRRA